LHVHNCNTIPITCHYLTTHESIHSTLQQFLKIMLAKTSQLDPTQIKKKLTQPRPIKKGIVTPRAVLKKPTPAKKQTPTPTPKKFVVPKDESDEVEDEDDGVDEENEEDSEGSQDDEEEVSELKEVKKKKTTKRSPATKKKDVCTAHPKRMFATIRKGNNSWYELAQDLFEPSCATGATALLPGQAPPKSEHEDTINVSSDVSGLSTNSVKRRKGIAKTIDVDSSGDDKVEDVKRAARDPPKKRFRENKYDILKNGVASIVDVLRGTPSQADIKPDTKPIVPPETKPEPTLTTRQEAIKLMASMYFGKVATIDYI
ncbi:hypothetical protein PSHT_08415, partial [Puccinia striiformis]